MRRRDSPAAVPINTVTRLASLDRAGRPRPHAQPRQRGRHESRQHCDPKGATGQSSALATAPAL